MSIRRARLLHPLLCLIALAVLALGDVPALAHDQAHVGEDAPHRGNGNGERDGASLCMR